MNFLLSMIVLGLTVVYSSPSDAAKGNSTICAKVQGADGGVSYGNVEEMLKTSDAYNTIGSDSKISKDTWNFIRPQVAQEVASQGHVDVAISSTNVYHPRYSKDSPWNGHKSELATYGALIKDLAACERTWQAARDAKVTEERRLASTARQAELDKHARIASLHGSIPSICADITTNGRTTSGQIEEFIKMPVEPTDMRDADAGRSDGSLEDPFGYFGTIAREAKGDASLVLAHVRKGSATFMEEAPIHGKWDSQSVKSEREKQYSAKKSRFDRYQKLVQLAIACEVAYAAAENGECNDSFASVASATKDLQSVRALPNVSEDFGNVKDGGNQEDGRVWGMKRNFFSR